ncbi:sugar phosphate isomerase/epimerase family protein [Allostreptomyces psammosilenae]|uniref:Sugar phosphate isomerase/epimerase n=1 Tax=Allostreptomyces psammosilenae TaxID=1892865 RepID=A0A853A3J8_9ACTN|nr:sugar phosphate isomerase/epimerase [Allostreptomyces psammosilenae]NYI05058.1 sugar phosphate isomerase/epimerase [Allostreptomyces psammosilenae]
MYRTPQDGNESPQHPTTPGPARRGRRTFLRGALAAAAFAGAAALPATATAAPTDAPAPAGPGSRPRRIHPHQISVQMYTLRQLAGTDLPGVLRALNRIGYQKVELAGTYGLTAAELRRLLRRNGLRASSSHVSLPQPFDEAAWRATVADALTLGQDYLVIPTGPWGNRDRTVWERYAADLDRAGRIASAAGLRFGYHNHDFEFRTLTDGTGTGIEVLLGQTDPRHVHFELDLYWAHVAGFDPAEFVARAPGRFRQAHVKDATPDGAFENVGRGVLDFPRIFAAARFEEYVVEHDSAGAAALTTAEIGHDYLRAVRY